MVEFEDKEEAPRDWFKSPGGVTEGNSAMATLSHPTTTAGRWAALMEGEPPVDESVQITSSDINRQTAARMAPTPELEAAVLRRQLTIAKVASERADAVLAAAGTHAAQARARYESIQAEIRTHRSAA